MHDLAIEHRPLASLRPWKRNARTHSRNQVRQIADSIGTFGFTNPVLVDEAGSILAGHGRVEAAKLLRLATVPCVRIEHMSEAQKRAYVLADNKLALNAGWDEDLLAKELADLQDLDFDISVTGFSIPEIDSLVDGLEPQEDGEPEAEFLPPLAEGETVCREGDVWQLGTHRLVCGNALDPAVVDQLMDGAQAQMVFTDPPYNVPVNGHVSGLGKVQHREFAMASGEMTSPEFVSFLQTAFRNMAVSYTHLRAHET